MHIKYCDFLSQKNSCSKFFEVHIICKKYDKSHFCLIGAKNLSKTHSNPGSFAAAIH